MVYSELWKVLARIENQREVEAKREVPRVKRMIDDMRLEGLDTLEICKRLAPLISWRVMEKVKEYIYQEEHKE